MKTCPYCGELVGEDVEECFNCHYNFKLHKVADNHKAAESDASNDSTSNPVFSELSKYEYAVEAVNDRADGYANVDGIRATLSRYAADGWRLHSVVSNEVGKNSGAIGVGNIGVGLNATVDQVVLIFERCIYHGKY